MIRVDVKIAFAALKSARVRTVLTMVGVIIGVSSVTLIMALGTGIKREVSTEIDRFGNNLLVILPGANSFSNGALSNISLFGNYASSSLTQNDVSAIQKVPGVTAAIPMMYVSGNVNHGSTYLNNPTVVATSEDLPKVFGLGMTSGGFFDPTITNKNVAVVGRQVAQTLFGDQEEAGETINIRGQQFTVIGILNGGPANSSFAGLLPNLNNSVFIPLTAGTSFYQGNTQLQQIDIKIASSDHAQDVISAVRHTVLAQHGYQRDFTIVQQQQALATTNVIIRALTTFTAAIASISLVVGGVGVMNIMLVSVTERTREIGIRKSIGATNGQILGQFLTEAMVISLGGGAIGLGLAYLISAIISIELNFSPVITAQIAIVAVSVSSSVGIIFGIAPAFKAARKDPIEALRRE